MRECHISLLNVSALVGGEKSDEFGDLSHFCCAKTVQHESESDLFRAVSLFSGSRSLPVSWSTARIEQLILTLPLSSFWTSVILTNTCKDIFSLPVEFHLTLWNPRKQIMNKKPYKRRIFQVSDMHNTKMI